MPSGPRTLLRGRDLRARVVGLLADRPMTAAELAAVLRVHRADVTDVLAAGGFRRAETPPAGSPRATYWTVAATGRNPSQPVPTHEQRLLAVLRDGKPHSHRDLYRLGMVVHSRVAVLRRRGHRIDCRRDGDEYLYRLVDGEAAA